MATEGIIEPCHDPKSFNSPIFAVCKKNGTIRVVANFKRTLNKVLVDLDPYLIPRIDQLFHKIGEGNKYFATLDLHSDNIGKSKSKSEIATKQRLHGETDATSTYA